MKNTLISPTLVRCYCPKVNYEDFVNKETNELDEEAYQEALQKSYNLNDMILTDRIDISELAQKYNITEQKVMELAYKGRF